MIYRSAQRCGADCVALFDKPHGGAASALATLAAPVSAILMTPSGLLHGAVLRALRGSQLPLI